VNHALDLDSINYANLDIEARQLTVTLADPSQMLVSYVLKLVGDFQQKVNGEYEADYRGDGPSGKVAISVSGDGLRLVLPEGPWGGSIRLPVIARHELPRILENEGRFPGVTLKRLGCTTPQPQPPPTLTLDLTVAVPGGRPFTQVQPLRLSAVYADGRVQEIPLDPRGSHKFEQVALPTEIRLRGDPDFKDDQLPVGGPGSLTLRLQAIDKTVGATVRDGIGPAVRGAKVQAALAGVRYDLTEGASGAYTGKMPLVRGDKVTLTASAPCHQDYNAEMEYRSGDPQWSIDLSAVPVSVKPTLLSQGESRLARANVTFQYRDLAGEHSTAAEWSAQGYGAYLGCPAPDRITVQIKDPGTGYLLPVEPPPVLGPPAPRGTPIQLQFAKPALAVLFNPNDRFTLGSTIQKNPQLLEDINVQVWRLFQELCTGETWGAKFAYRYLMTIHEKGPREVLLSQEDIVADFGEKARNDALEKTKTQGSAVAPESAIRDTGHFLDGFSYPPTGTRGVLVYLLRAEANPIRRDDPRLRDLDAMLGETRMVAVVAQFLPGGSAAQRNVLTTQRHKNLRYLEFSDPEEEHDYYKGAFDKIKQTVAEIAR
jgi:hypothetical protein